MSTPVSVPSPQVEAQKKQAKLQHHRSDSEQQRDIQDQLTLMLDLQYSQMDITPSYYGNTSTSSNNNHQTSTTSNTTLEKPPVSPPVVTNPSDATAASKQPPTETSTLSTAPAKPASANFPNSPANSGVGKGTLFFSNEYQSQYGNNSSSKQQQQQPSPPIGQISYAGGGGYGALSSSSPDPPLPPPPPPPPPSERQPQQQHEYHYGNPDYHDPYYQQHNHHHPELTSTSASTKNANNKQRPFIYRCCCILQPLVALLSVEQLQRSFCYGAIDGLLTGSGIASAFSGVGVLSMDTPWGVRLAVVVISASACLADSLCMAIGHVWTCYVVSTGHSEERAKEREQLDFNRADAKGKLVDMLLARGMLKIDAMSLADTLEGYPDLFVNTLMGDALLGGEEIMARGGGGEDDNASGDDDEDYYYSARANEIPSSFGHFSEQQPALEEHPHGMNWSVLAESRKEGIFMLLGFATFAIIPSLLWLIFPLIIPKESSPPSSSSSATESETVGGSGDVVISIQSLIVTFIAIVMWILGVWKSHFLESNWLIFGIETVLVLFVCVMSSYCVGATLAYLLQDSLDVKRLLLAMQQQQVEE